MCAPLPPLQLGGGSAGESVPEYSPSGSSEFEENGDEKVLTFYTRGPPSPPSVPEYAPSGYSEFEENDFRYDSQKVGILTCICTYCVWSWLHARLLS